MFFVFSAPENPPLWWQVVLNISTSGEYAYKPEGNTPGFNGTFFFNIVVVGTLQEDGGDYMFMQLLQQTQASRWKETVSGPVKQSAVDLSNKLRPDITINYAFLEKGILSFDFSFKPLPVPFKNKFFLEPHTYLDLPESAGEETIREKLKYKMGIISGDNRVALPNKLIYDNVQTNREFAWKWKQNNPGNRWTSSHEITVKLTIIRRVNKGTPGQ